jgi:hypothetical protein
MENRNNTGVLFKNDRKQEELQPDYKGVLTFNDQEYWLSGWIKQGKAGKFIGLAFTPKTAEQIKPKTTSKSGFEDMPDDIPF